MQRPKSILRTVEMHTGGEPVRIVVEGWPTLPSGTILEKRAHAREHHDDLRRLLMFEPRGHADMYGALLVEPNLPGADLAVLFMHNEGWSTMCGHAVIALGRYAVDHGLVTAVEPVTQVGIECPCGLVVASVEVADGKSGAVSFVSVPSFLLRRDLAVDVPGIGRVITDIAYGGAFYALAPAAALGLDFAAARARNFIDAGEALCAAVNAATSIDHPDERDLGFLYGAILTDGGDGGGATSRNVCIFAEGQIDRSPTGSGVTARMAAMQARGEAAIGETRRFGSITGSEFEATLVEPVPVGPHAGVTVRVSGRAHYSGRCEFWLEDGDALGRGFLVR